MLAATFNIEYIADIAFVLILLIFAIVDGKKGFVACFFSIITLIVSLLAMFFFSGPILNATGGLFGLEGVIQVGLGDWISTIKPFNLDISMDGWQAQMEAMALPQFLADAVLAEINAVVGDIPAGTMLGQYVGQIIGTFVATIICAIAVFLVVKLIMALLRGLLTKIVNSCGLFKKINLLGGILAGVVKGFALLCAVLALVSLIPVPEIGVFFDGTLFVGMLYHENPLMAILSTFVVA